MERTRSDYMGMLGTVMNSLALQDFLEKEGIVTRVQTAITMGQVAEPTFRCAPGGTSKRAGWSSSAQAWACRTSHRHHRRAAGLEIGADVVLMAKAVDVSSPPTRRVDPLCRTRSPRSPIAKSFDRGLKVADATAFSLCMDNGMPILVFNLLTDGNIARAVAGEKIGTLVTT